MVVLCNFQYCLQNPTIRIALNTKMAISLCFFNFAKMQQSKIVCVLLV